MAPRLLLSGTLRFVRRVFDFVAPLINGDLLFDEPSPVIITGGVADDTTEEHFSGNSFGVNTKDGRRGVP